ncbi:helix-turn-helix domain-containing protein [Laribacter hongkongensis]|uniref:helix-turn-helix domain-containing protein n=1 Tax=Laribacter hongkongensis TaxID=168471 RepID=UPI001EFD98D1|nr:helix-turn-helix transcriptional regulator [Laribacter hongkongensis]MCG9082357.1 helix-turn-helix domain-containing protein [Laribacter hongkongensis]MCG9096951.1 helix-turn-helix domain-containing protein [Laribacter hongkongensis]
MVKKELTTVFGRRLREARRRAAIPQDQLGVKIGLDEGTASARMSRYETGAHEPPFSIAMKLAQALSVPTAYFYCEDDELADLVLAWGRVTRLERERIKNLITSMLTD